MIGGLAPKQEPIPVIACPSSKTLWAVSEQRSVPLGQVEPGVRFTVLDAPAVGEGQVAVGVGAWLTAREGWQFQLDEAGCTRSTFTPKPNPIEEALREGAEAEQDASPAPEEAPSELPEEAP